VFFTTAPWWEVFMSPRETHIKVESGISRQPLVDSAYLWGGFAELNTQRPRLLSHSWRFQLMFPGMHSNEPEKRSFISWCITFVFVLPSHCKSSGLYCAILCFNNGCPTYLTHPDPAFLPTLSLARSATNQVKTLSTLQKLLVIFFKLHIYILRNVYRFITLKGNYSSKGISSHYWIANIRLTKRIRK